MAVDQQPPASVVDANGEPRFGLYRGAPERVDLERLAGKYGRGALYRFAHRKRWRWAMVATPRVLVAFAIADLSYAANAFVLAADVDERKVLIDRGFLGLPRLSVAVGDRPARDHSWFRGPGIEAVIRPALAGSSIGVRVRTSGFDLAAEMDATAVPSVTLIAPVTDGGMVNVTQKASALPVTGEVRTPGRTYSLDGGLGGFDYTNGLLARHTEWRWAFTTGRSDDGHTIGLNLVEGFNEAGAASENVLWVDGAILALGHARFEFDRGSTLSPWRVTTRDGSVDLEFEPIGQHREERNLIIARSSFVQPFGTFHGTVRTPSGPLHVSALPGVVEDQRVTW
ncbi:MAG TPA: DUF2804 domain-containing protein [Candidatus Limnocylindria bacterium]|jgi:hypothetical protein|nr:DUF2804 domain-containing protein [Candidatus Limnocylindria bacterium]